MKRWKEGLQATSRDGDTFLNLEKGCLFLLTASQECLKRRGFDFSVIYDFDWQRIIEDARRDYGEKRYRAFGFIFNKPHSVVFTPRGHKIRIISIRRMHNKERERYDIRKT